MCSKKTKKQETYMFSMKAQKWSVTYSMEMMKTMPCEQGHQSHYTHTQTDATIGSFYTHTHVFQFHYNTHEVWWIHFKTQWNNKWNDQKSHVQASLLLHNHWDATWARMIATTSDRLQKGQEKKKKRFSLSWQVWNDWHGSGCLFMKCYIK